MASCTGARTRAGPPTSWVGRNQPPRCKKAFKNWNSGKSIRIHTVVERSLASWRFISVFLIITLAPAAFAASVAVDVGHYLGKPGVISARGVTEFEYNRQL